MNRPLKADLIAGICAIVAVGAIEAAFANTENDFFQFCTTKAYGWPPLGESIIANAKVARPFIPH
jgi:hypothetical protein